VYIIVSYHLQTWYAQQLLTGHPPVLPALPPLPIHRAEWDNSVTTIDQVWAAEADAWTQQGLLPLRNDAYMFHQVSLGLGLG
jgi:hypothetical protein